MAANSQGRIPMKAYLGVGAWESTQPHAIGRLFYSKKRMAGWKEVLLERVGTDHISEESLICPAFQPVGPRFLVIGPSDRQIIDGHRSRSYTIV